MDRLSGISQGAKDATAYGFFEKIKGLLPKFEGGGVEAEDSPRGGLAGEIADVSRMVQEPQSDSSDWSDMQMQFLQTDDLNDLSEGDLRYLYKKVFGDTEGGETWEMIDALEVYRDTGL